MQEVVLNEIGNVPNCGESAFGTKERDQGSDPEGEEPHTDPPFGQSGRTTEPPPEKYEIVKNLCFVNEELTRKIFFRMNI